MSALLSKNVFLNTKDISFGKTFPSSSKRGTWDKTNAAIIDKSIIFRAVVIVKNDKTSDLIANVIKNYEKCAAKKGYIGFSYEIHSIHDPVSSYIIIMDNSGNIVSYARITVKNKDNKLPIEYAIIKYSDKKYNIKENQKICEINTFAYSDRSSLPILYDSILGQLHINNIDKILVMVDPENSTTSFLYSSLGFKASKNYNEQIFFPTYGKEINKKLYPTYWNILELETRKMSPNYPSFLL